MTYPNDVRTKLQSLVSTGLSVAAAARELSVPLSTAKNWVAKARHATAPARSLLAQTLTDDSELARLRRENAILRQLVGMLLGEDQ